MLPSVDQSHDDGVCKDFHPFAASGNSVSPHRCFPFPSPSRPRCRSCHPVIRSAEGRHQRAINSGNRVRGKHPTRASPTFASVGRQLTSGSRSRWYSMHDPHSKPHIARLLPAAHTPHFRHGMHRSPDPAWPCQSQSAAMPGIGTMPIRPRQLALPRLNRCQRGRHNSQRRRSTCRTTFLRLCDMIGLAPDLWHGHWLQSTTCLHHVSLMPGRVKDK